MVYDGKNGLSENRITAIRKDNYGLMWIGTKNGLNSFDGYTFKKISGILNSAAITKLVFDETTAILWIGTSKGLFSINTHTYKIEEHKISGPQKVIDNHVTAIYLLNSECFVLFNDGSLTVSSRKGKAFKRIAQLPTSNFKDATMAAYPDGNLFIGINSKCFKLNRNTNTLEALDKFQYAKSYINESTQFDKTHLIINTYNNGSFLFNLKSGTETIPDYLKKSNTIYKNVFFTEIKNGNLYIASSGYGFAKIEPQSGQILDISQQNKVIFGGKQLNCIFIDDQNIIWIGTNKGIIKYEEKENLFENLLLNKGMEISTRGIVEDNNGDLYIGTYNGLYNYTKSKERWQLLKNNRRLPNTRIYQDILPYSMLNEKDYMYVGTETFGFFKLSKQSANLEAILQKDKKPFPSTIFSIVKSPDGLIWMGGNNGLASYDPISNTINLHKNDHFSLGEITIHQLSISNNKQDLLAATTNGMYIINLKTGNKLHFNTKTPLALSNDDVFFIHQDPHNNYWLGTNGGGLNKLSADLKQVSFIKKENGLSNDIIYGILQESERYLWISTFDGLNRLDMQTREFINYYEDQGLSSDEFNKNSCFIAKDGKMYFGSINGINAFYPAKIAKARQPKFSILLSAITKWDNATKTFLTTNKFDFREIKIVKKPSDPMTELYFACSDYANPSKNKYFYRIKGVYDNWVSLGNNHSYNLNGIPYGNYVLEVKALNSRGVSSENTLKINLAIIFPIYKEWWFYLLIALSLASVIYGVYYFKLLKIKALVKLRMNIASNLHDEVGSLLTRITMFSDNLIYTQNNKEQQQVKLEKIALLSREATESMSDVLWSIDSRNDFTGNLTDRMKEQAEDMLESQGYLLNFDFSETNFKQHLPSELRRNVYLIFKEAINNIVKHAAKNAEVSISFALNDKKLFLSVINNKIIDRTAFTSTGQGLKNMKMRAEKINATLDVKIQDRKFIVTMRN